MSTSRQIPSSYEFNYYGMTQIKATLEQDSKTNMIRVICDNAIQAEMLVKHIQNIGAKARDSKHNVDIAVVETEIEKIKICNPINKLETPYLELSENQFYAIKEYEHIYYPKPAAGFSEILKKHSLLYKLFSDSNNHSASFPPTHKNTNKL